MMMSSEDACACEGTVHAGGTPGRGSIVQIDGADYYHVGAGAAKTIVLAYDIFGICENKNVYGVCDILADKGFQVIMPDFFKGDAFPKSKFPLKDRQELLDWIDTKNPAVPGMLDAAVAHVQQNGAKSLGMLGLCWGGGWAAKAVTEETGKGRFAAAAGIHPSFITPEVAASATGPILLILTSNDGDHEEVMAELAKKPFGAECSKQRFEDQTHGFMAARGDWADPATKARVDEALDKTAAFFGKHLAVAS